MRKRLFPVVLCLLFIGCTQTSPNVKQVYYGYHKTIEALRYAVVDAAIEGRIDVTTKIMLYAFIDQAAELDNLTKRVLRRYEEGRTTLEVLNEHMAQLSDMVFEIVQIVQSQGISVEEVEQ